MPARKLTKHAAKPHAKPSAKTQKLKEQSDSSNGASTTRELEMLRQLTEARADLKRSRADLKNATAGDKRKRPSLKVNRPRATFVYVP